MRFIVMHKTNAHWEAGVRPSPELVARVGGLLGELAQAGVLESGEGLRASSHGARLTCSGGTCTRAAGPFVGRNELPAGFSIVRAPSLDDAVLWAESQAQVLGDCEIDVRPVTEPWDIGLGTRPADATTRFMLLRKATPATEAGLIPTASQRQALQALEAAGSGTHLATETLRPSARGRRYKNSRDGVSVTDGPFTESKELIAGYVIVRADGLDAAARWALRYIDVVEAGEVDLRALE